MDVDAAVRRGDKFSHRGRLRTGKIVGQVKDCHALDAERRTVLGEKVRQRLRPDRRDRVGDENNVRIVGRKERGTSASAWVSHLK
jgi:hypothetical protein